MNQKFIVIDGKMYKSVNEMPPDIRKKYEDAMQNLDKNNNGIPDVLEAKDPGGEENEAMFNVFGNMTPFQSMGVANSTKFVVNGQTYDSMDQLPPEIQAKYQQVMAKLARKGLNVPNLDQLPPEKLARLQQVLGRFMNNEQILSNLDQLPPERRAKVQQAFNMLDANNNGIPDFMEGVMASQNKMGQQMSMNFAQPTPAPTQSTPVFSAPMSSTVEPESTNKWLWIIVGLVFVGSCLVLLGAGAWYYFLR